jgi:hypothetical protein
MKSVEFKNGYKTVMKDKIAEIYAKKGKVKILGEAKEPEREQGPKKKVTVK